MIAMLATVFVTVLQLLIDYRFVLEVHRSLESSQIVLRVCMGLPKPEATDRRRAAHKRSTKRWWPHSLHVGVKR